MSGFSGKFDILANPPAGNICEVECVNLMPDGTIVTGFLVTFTYEDKSTSTANAVGPWKYNEGSSVFSLDKCVHVNSIQIGTKRPNGIVEIVKGTAEPAPPGQCLVHDVWSLSPAKFVAASDRGKLENAPMSLRND